MNPVGAWVSEALRRVGIVYDAAIGKLFSIGLTGGFGEIVWRPDGQSCTARTWEDVMQLATAAKSFGVPVVIRTPQPSPALSPIYIIPPGTYEFAPGSRFENPPGDGSNSAISAAGVQFFGLSYFTGGVRIEVLTTTGSFINDNIFLTEKGAQIYMDPGSGPPCMASGAPGEFVSVAQVLGGSFDGGPGNKRLLDLAPGSNALMTFVSTFSLTQDCIAGDPTSTVLFQHDGCVPTFVYAPFLPNYAGLLLNFAMTQDGGWGSTAQRPGPWLGDIRLGTLYYNTDLAAYEMWDGASWITPIP